MTISHLPLTINHTLFPPGEWRSVYRWIRQTVPQDFTGWTGRLQVRAAHGQPLLLDLTTENTGIALTSAGLITIVATGTQVSALEVSMLNVNALRYDLNLHDPAGPRIKFLQGQLTIVESISEAAL